MIIRTISESMKMIANAMVMRSRFFSTMLVPVWVEYTELAIMSEMPGSSKSSNPSSNSEMMDIKLAITLFRITLSRKSLC